VIVSADLMVIVRGLKDGTLAASRQNLAGALERIALKAQELENRVRNELVERRTEGTERSLAIATGYVNDAITKARWVLSDKSSSQLARELAESVIVIAGRANPT